MRRLELKITAPAGLGDKQPFTTHAADEPVRVTVEAKDKPAKVELYDGATRLGEARAPYEFAAKLKPGVHSLIAVATDEKGGQSVSRPHTILVRRK